MTSRNSPPEGWTAVSLSVVFPEVVSARLVEVARGLTTFTDLQHYSLEATTTIRESTLSEEWLQAPNQQAARVWVSVLLDLVVQGWKVRVEDGVVWLAPPASDTEDVVAEKSRVRAAHLIERDTLLRDEGTRRFVVDMERARLHGSQWKSIFSLFRDGQDMRDAIEVAVSEKMPSVTLDQVIDPYIQVAAAGVNCEHTGLDLYDVWRYLRLTWSTVPQSVPGRRIHILIRDRAAANHPIIGIAALGSPVVQLSVRDKWIGWEAATFIAMLDSQCNAETARWLNDCLGEAITEVYVADFLRDGTLMRRDLRHPSAELTDRLRKEGAKARAAHERYARAGKHKAASTQPLKTNWKLQAETYLFRSKRALTLAALLTIKMAFSAASMESGKADNLRSLLSTGAGRKAIGALLRSIKARYVGIRMAEITTCGAIAPYSHLLGGKLVALLLTSPEIQQIYARKYDGAVSLIASSMAGKVVRRTPKLVLLGTTSLYGSGSSQYNRLVIPTSHLGNGACGEIRFRELGRTVGFGSFHFSQATIDEMDLLVQQRRNGRRVNSIFGEGVSPKLRRIREALSECGFPANVLMQHGSPRIVYGVPLTTNFRELLLGRSKRMRPIFGRGRPRELTDAIVRFWRERWLVARVKRPEVLDLVGSHRLINPVRHGARVILPDVPEALPLFRNVDG